MHQLRHWRQVESDYNKLRVLHSETDLLDTRLNESINKQNKSGALVSDFKPVARSSSIFINHRGSDLKGIKNLDTLLLKKFKTRRKSFGLKQQINVMSIPKVNSLYNIPAYRYLETLPELDSKALDLQTYFEKQPYQSKSNVRRTIHGIGRVISRNESDRSIQVNLAARLQQPIFLKNDKESKLLERKLRNIDSSAQHSSNTLASVHLPEKESITVVKNL